VLEPLHGYIILAEKLLSQQPQFASAFNFAPSDEDVWTVDRIADRMAALWGKDAAWTRDPEPGVHEAAVLRLDASKARAELGWQPGLRIETALEWTIGWFRACEKGAHMQQRTQEQIADYEQLLERTSLHGRVTTAS
jgi:CDP-glucose 4,6-dehydratase